MNRQARAMKPGSNDNLSASGTTALLLAGSKKLRTQTNDKKSQTGRPVIKISSSFFSRANIRCSCLILKSTETSLSNVFSEVWLCPKDDYTKVNYCFLRLAPLRQRNTKLQRGGALEANFRKAVEDTIIVLRSVRFSGESFLEKAVCKPRQHPIKWSVSSIEHLGQSRSSRISFQLSCGEHRSPFKNPKPRTIA